MTKPTYKLPSDLVLDIKIRLKTLSGQLNGIVKILEENKGPEHLNIQFKSVDKGLQKAHYLLLDEVYRKDLAIGIVKTIYSCSGNCGNEEKNRLFKKGISKYCFRRFDLKIKRNSNH